MKKLLVQVAFSNSTEYFIEVDEEPGLTYELFHDFLYRRLKEDPERLSSTTTTNIAIIELVNDGELGFPAIGKSWRSASRYVMINHVTYFMQVRVVHIKSIYE